MDIPNSNIVRTPVQIANSSYNENLTFEDLARNRNQGFKIIAEKKPDEEYSESVEAIVSGDDEGEDFFDSSDKEHPE